MIIQNQNGENKIFIEDNLGNFNIIKDKHYNMYFLTAKDHDYFTVTFKTENIELNRISSMSIIYDKICTSTDCTKYIKDDEIVSIENIDDEIVINTIKLPKFLQYDTDDKYPKFEINMSDCIYSMKIYIDESTYIEIPDYESHPNILGTIQHISDVIFYLTEGRPTFINDLCNHKYFDLTIYKDSKAIWGAETYYKMGEDGLYLTAGELDNYLVPWQRFFRLVIDRTWEVDFNE